MFKKYSSNLASILMHEALIFYNDRSDFKPVHQEPGN